MIPIWMKLVAQRATLAQGSQMRCHVWLPCMATALQDQPGQEPRPAWLKKLWVGERITSIVYPFGFLCGCARENIHTLHTLGDVSPVQAAVPSLFGHQQFHVPMTVPYCTVSNRHGAATFPSMPHHTRPTACHLQHIRC